MTEATQILKPPKIEKKLAAEKGAKPSAAEKIWPDKFDVVEAKKLFAPVEDPVSLECYYELWRMSQGHQADANQIAACKALIEQRIGRAFQKSPLGASSLEGVSIEYLDPEEVEDGD